MKRFFNMLISLCLVISFCAALPVAYAEEGSSTSVVTELSEDENTEVAELSEQVWVTSSVKGDFNGDEFVTTEDVRYVLMVAAGQADALDGVDFNGDGIVSIKDAQLVYIETLSYVTDEEYVQNLLDAGFTKSYVEDILALHKKYPEWEFVPFITNLTWSEAVEGEHTPHNKQLIENIVSADLMCSCSSCKGVIQEASNWVSASEAAVEYYLDPRNFLNEKDIFQFETTAYDETHTATAVESILKSTWMYNSNITYLDANGNTVTYKKNGVPVKYSQAIMQAAKDSGMSAYYLASKIVQEVGSSSSANAGGSSGKNSPYNGIYNYYNIGAYTGAGDGLRWANGLMNAKTNATMYKTTSAGSAVVVTVPKGTELNYVGTSGNFYNVKATVNGTRYSGYIAKSNVNVSSTYGRPWDSPYKSIYYGAQYIYESFSETQFTGYLQKFNVNPASDTLYGHEYMANIRAAVAESQKTYVAYNDSGVLENKKVFSIPVFKDMPYGDMTAEEMFINTVPQVTATTTEKAVTLRWDAIKGASYYQVFKYDEASSGYKMLKATSATTYTDTLTSGATAKYRIRGFYMGSEGFYIFTQYSKVMEIKTAPATPTGLYASEVKDNSIRLKWNAVAADGYYVYRYNSVSGYVLAGTVTEAQFYDTSLLSGTTYLYKVCAYYKTSSMVAVSAQTAALSVKTTGEAQRTGVVKVGDYLNIRSSASTSSSVVTTASNGQAVLILETLDGWYKVQFALNGITYTGYASADYIVLNEIKPVCPYTEPAVTLKKGDTGEGVKWLQWYLSQLGYLSESDIDGDFGGKTDTAVRSFQTAQGLTVDGLVGSGTRNALKNLI